MQDEIQKRLAVIRSQRGEAATIGELTAETQRVFWSLDIIRLFYINGSESTSRLLHFVDETVDSGEM